MPSQITFHGKYVNITDGDATFLLQMLLDAIPKTQSDEWSRRVRSRWESRLAGCGHGLYELELEELVTNSAEKQRMVQLFDLARNAISAHGPYLKEEWLNSLPHNAVIYLGDQDTSISLDNLDQIEASLKTAKDL
jgi:hypothetical protein